MAETAAQGRTLRGFLAWGATALIAAVTLAHAVRSGKGWGTAAGGLAMFVLFGFLPRIEAANARRWKKKEGTLTVDEWGVTRVAGDLREAIAWDDLAWVRIYTTSDGPGSEDLFFALGDAGGRGCLVPNGLASSADLLAALQKRLPNFDNAAVIQAMGSTSPAVFPLWTRAPDPAKSRDDERSPS